MKKILASLFLLVHVLCLVGCEKAHIDPKDAIVIDGKYYAEVIYNNPLLSNRAFSEKITIENNKIEECEFLEYELKGDFFAFVSEAHIDIFEPIMNIEKIWFAEIMQPEDIESEIGFYLTLANSNFYLYYGSYKDNRGYFIDFAYKLIRLDMSKYDCENGENDYFTLNDVVFDVNNISEIPCPMSAIELYYISKNNYFSIYECKKNKESKIIAGYLDIKTIEVLDEMSQTLVSPLCNGYYISGIDNYLKKYQDAVMSGKINENENPIECKYVSMEQLLLIDGNRRLIFVLEEKSINAENIKTNENIEFKLYSNVDGYISSGIFYIKECEPNRNSFTHFLFADTSVNKYYTENKIQFSFLNIYDNKYIEEYSNAIIYHTNSEDYYQNIKKIIISEEKNLIENITFKYDYIEMLKILKGE